MGGDKFKPGDSVRILPYEDFETCAGGWNDDMEECFGHVYTLSYKVPHPHGWCVKEVGWVFDDRYMELVSDFEVDDDFKIDILFGEA